MPHSIQQFTKLKQKPFTTVTARICLHLTQTQSDTVAAHTQKQGYHNYYSVVCLTTGSKPPPKRFLHIVRSKASSFKWEYPLLSLRSSSSFLRLLPRLLIYIYIYCKKWYTDLPMLRFYFRHICCTFFFFKALQWSNPDAKFLTNYMERASSVGIVTRKVVVGL